MKAIMIKHCNTLYIYILEQFRANLVLQRFETEFQNSRTNLNCDEAITEEISNQNMQWINC